MASIDLRFATRLYRARLTYTATLITNPTPNKPAKKTTVGG